MRTFCVCIVDVVECDLMPKVQDVLVAASWRAVGCQILGLVSHVIQYLLPDPPLCLEEFLTGGDRSQRSSLNLRSYIIVGLQCL